MTPGHPWLICRTPNKESGPQESMTLPVGLQGSMRRLEDDFVGVLNHLKRKEFEGKRWLQSLGGGSGGEGNTVKRWGLNPGCFKGFHEVEQVTPFPSVKWEGLTWRSTIRALLLMIFYREATNKEMQAELLWERRNKRVWRCPALCHHTAPLKYLCEPLGFRACQCPLKNRGITGEI